MNLISIEDIRRAADTVKGTAVRTPLLPARWVDGGELWLKPESLQPVGAFKIRGAVHAVASLDPQVRVRGVITHSSGNHGRALAYVAKEFGIPAVIVMPDVTPKVKVAAVDALGAEIVLVKPQDRVRVMTEIAEQRGMTVVPPFDHPNVIAGQGTVGLEIIEDLPDVDTVLVPVGGGGLAAGMATAVKALNPSARVFGVEPELAADAKESLDSGVRVEWPVERTYRTSADGLRTNLSELTFAHLKARLDGILTVTEDEIAATVGLLARESNLVVEPSGAVAPAAYLYRRDQLPFGKTVAVISGGNLEPATLAELVLR